MPDGARLSLYILPAVILKIVLWVRFYCLLLRMEIRTPRWSNLPSKGQQGNPSPGGSFSKWCAPLLLSKLSATVLKSKSLTHREGRMRHQANRKEPTCAFLDVGLENSDHVLRKSLPVWVMTRCLAKRQAVFQPVGCWRKKMKEPPACSQSKDSCKLHLSSVSHAVPWCDALFGQGK